MATLALGAALSGFIGPEDFIALSGDLGAGKTTLARSLIQARQRAAGVPPDEVQSPTFTLVQTYEAGPLTLWHLIFIVLNMSLNCRNWVWMRLWMRDVYWRNGQSDWEPMCPVTAWTLSSALKGRAFGLPVRPWHMGSEIEGDHRQIAERSRGCVMTEREQLRNAFLKRTKWADAVVAPLAGDASTRRYFRLAGTAGKALLMDAPPAAEAPTCPPGASVEARKAAGYNALACLAGPDVTAFVAIAKWLARLGLSPPRIFDQDRCQRLFDH